MSEETFAITRLESGGLITNYHCSSACRHCLYRCSPRWPKEYISARVAKEALAVIRRYGCRSIHVGGGEPLLNPGCVETVLDMARHAGVHVEYVETNSSWYQNHNEACLIFEKLRDKGLSTLLVSISPFHNEHIPFYKVKGIVAACQQTGISVFPWISAFVPEVTAFDEMRVHSLEEYERHFGEGYVENLPRRYWIAPGGRALETFGKFSPPQTVEALIAESSAGCSELRDISHFHIDLYGNYVPGLCAGLSIRKEDLGKPLDPHEYPIITTLYNGGVGSLVSYALQRSGFRASKPVYASKCALCYEIRRFLFVTRGDDSSELLPREHYIYG